MKTGGRKAGTPNKATSTLHELVEQEAGAPLPVLLTRIGIKAMKAGDHQLAVNALSRAAVFVYPRVPPSDPLPLPLPNVIINVPEQVCTSCGHDPAKQLHIHRHIINGPKDAIP